MILHKFPLPLILIFATPITLMALSYSLFFLNQQQYLTLTDLTGMESTGNLIQPAIQLAPDTLQPLLDTANATANAPVWTLLVLTQNNCTACDNRLVQSRQMHIALGKQANRIQRVQLFIDHRPNNATMTKTRKAHPKLAFAAITTDKLDALLAPNHRINDIGYLLVDPRGWLMMAYGSNIQEKAIMLELKHLFKYSR